MRAAVPLHRSLLVTGFAAAMLLGSVQTGLSNECKPHHFRAPFFIKSMGACAFDPETLSYAGTPVEQAMCLMRGMDATRNLGPPLQSLPPGLASRIGETTGLPSREALASFLSKQNLEADFAAQSVAAAIARARQRSRRAAGALFCHSRYQRAGFRPPWIPRRHQ